MVEIVGRIVGHPKPFHDVCGSDVLRNGHGDDFIQACLIEGKTDARARGFRRVASPPELRGKTPPDFDARREMSLERWNSQAHESDKRGLVDHFDGPESEAMPLEVRLDAFDDRIALSTRQDGGEVLHHADVRIEISERRSIRLHPAP
jgi:hypothetical protein